MIKVIKGNQIVIIIVAIMLVTVGYLNYGTNNNQEELIAVSSNEVQKEGIGDAKLVNSEPTTNEYSYTEALVENEEETIIAKSETQEEEKVEDKKDDYFTNSRIERENMYSQMIETYEKILANANIASDQKTIAQTEIKNINDNKNKIMICENLIKTKGIENVVIFVNGESISVVIKSESLQDEQVAQIQNIVAREMQVEINNIHISNK